jgi:hypothetical protein
VCPINPVTNPNSTSLLKVIPKLGCDTIIALIIYTNLKLPYLKKISSFWCDQRPSLIALAFKVFSAGTQKFMLE